MVVKCRLLYISGPLEINSVSQIYYYVEYTEPREYLRNADYSCGFYYNAQYAVFNLKFE